MWPHPHQLDAALKNTQRALEALSAKHKKGAALLGASLKMLAPKARFGPV